MTNWLAQNGRAMLELTGQHLQLVLIAIAIALMIGLPTGVWLSRHAQWQAPVLGLANVFQTVPSLALFGLLLPFLGLGAPTAIVALVLYALLPIVRNTFVGLRGVDSNVREAARAMGMTDRQLLWHVELPLSLGVILAGVRVATVLCVGVTTIAATIDGGGLGQLIFRGMRQNDNALILAGAVPAALLALVLDGVLGRMETQLSRHSAPVSDGRNSVFPTHFPSLQAPPQRVKFGGTLLGIGLIGLLGLSLLNRRQTVSQSERVWVVASKDFSESVILAEILAQRLEARGQKVRRRFELAGNLAHEALLSGEVDVYPEYTGTAYTAILKNKPISDVQRVYNQTKAQYAQKFGLEIGPPLGFSNDFAILVRGRDAKQFNLKTISDAVGYARTRQAGFGQDFMSRADGFPGFSRAYKLQFARAPREMDLSLTYRALASGKVDMIAGNSTDGLIAALDLTQLQDDKRYFPPYQAVFIARQKALQQSPVAMQVLAQLKDAISTEEMRRMNLEADGKKRDIRQIASQWIAKHPAK